jgi:hypothetical protein
MCNCGVKNEFIIKTKFIHTSATWQYVENGGLYLNIRTWFKSDCNQLKT